MPVRPKYLDTFLSGVQRVQQRFNRCTCGCHGTDWAHKQVVKRAVNVIALFDQPQRRRFDEWPQDPVDVIAVGTYRNVYDRPCGLWVWQKDDGSWRVLGWVQIWSLEGDGPVK